MDKQQAQQIIKDTFEHSFDMDRFTVFIKNLLNRIDESKAFHAHGYVKEGFRGIIKTYERIGTYNSADDKEVDIIVVYLQKGSSLDHARVTQRNFAGKYLTDRGQKDAGLFAFISPDQADWRFSLVKMDYKFDKNGKVKEEFTPARRWSFLVGANERSHTAQSRLVNILANDEKAPTLQEIENAFDIETVSREFFREYRNLFLRTKDELDNVVNKDPKIKADFEAKGVDTVNFAKKLLGQIVFLYFLQKKGWFGVGRDDDWGTGSKNFLRELFEKKHLSAGALAQAGGDYLPAPQSNAPRQAGNNFFNDILEPLFYEALRIDRSHDDGYYSRFNCKIPFLNGGLFDPIGNYDWVHTDIIIPDRLFSNSEKTKEGDTGTGILDIFDRYNFTVKEDEPLEKEVAIDPELLGKAYEKFNAIRPDNFEEYKKALKSGKKGDESKFNKQFGVYYTPREIVHYMCQQSLINYLFTELNTGKSSYEKLSDPNLYMFDNGIKRGQLDFVIKHGSQEAISKEDIEMLIHYGEHVSENEARVISEGRETKTYSHKLPESIRKNAKLIDDKLSDIAVCDPAVGSGAFPVGMMSEIVKTRNVLTPFLSLRGTQVTKQSQFDDNRTVYNFKRRCIEHSLYGVDIDPGAVEIAKLRLWLSLVVDEDDIKQIKPLPNLDYKIVCGNSLLGVEKNLFNFNLFNELEKLKPLFFNETNPTKKHEYKKQIDKLISEITSGHTEFDFEVYFSEVFHNKGGFDVVIANPPYGIVYKTQLKHLLEKRYSSFTRNNDIYIAFYERGLMLTRDNGFLIYISPNTFLNGDYFKIFREYLTRKTTIQEIFDFKELPVFEDPTVFVCTLGCIRTSNIKFPYQFDLRIAKGSVSEYELSRVEIRSCTISSLKDENRIYSKIIAEDGVEIVDKLFYVKDVGFNYWTKGKGKKRDGTSIGSRVFYSGKQCNKKDIPFLKGRDIFKYGFSNASNFLRHDFEKFLDPFIDTLRFSPDFLERIPKIIYRQTANKIIAALDTEGNYLDKTVHLIVPKPTTFQLNLKYILALLNSRLFKYIYEYISQEREGRVFAQVKTTYIKQLPIKILRTQQKEFIGLVDKILSHTQSDDYLENSQKQAEVKTLEAEIDQLVYKLYGLSDKCQYIDNSTKCQYNDNTIVL